MFAQWEEYEAEILWLLEEGVGWIHQFYLVEVYMGQGKRLEHMDSIFP
jgi:hypothetical protein